MKIIGGSLKGRNIYAPRGEAVRPTADKVRGSIFDTLQTVIGGARFLDLFAGSGAVGIEAYSRGADEVVFCERSTDALSYLKRNVSLLGDKAKIYAGDSIASIGRLRGRFDIIFCDPPYADDCLAQVCSAIDAHGALKDDGVIIYERSSLSPVPAPDGYRIIKSRRYGAATLDYLVKGGSICVFAGSFDPFTRGHLEVVKRAREIYEQVVVLIAVNDCKPYRASLEQRKQVVDAAIAGMDGVECDICDGYVYKYCNRRGITNLVRGVRNAIDDAYERDMAAYNKSKGGLDTQFIECDLADISSTALLAGLSRGEDISDMCAADTEQLIRNIYGRR
ncbi:MAG: 16S rRNA (guanine(966)-N(2))-methyltransferase RsmD [Clostridia bacterium]|nr:16S rRNA (guanine(966)-N(2))-methyltransferase RsmD [Clostridia bacterium]